MEEALAAAGHLLTAGELHVARTLLALPPAPAGLYARLHGRKGVVFRLDGLAYAEVPDVDGAVAALVEAGLADRAEARLPVAALARQLTVPELRAACAALGRPSTGRRAELLDRLADAPARPVVARPALLLRHQGLFDRLARIFLGRADSDLSRLVLERMEVVRWPRYTPTGGGGLFPDRRSLRAWEEGLALDAQLAALGPEEELEALVARLPADLSLCERAPAGPAWRRRYTARRLAERRVAAAAFALERMGRPAEAVAAWRRLLAAGPHRADHAAHRLALALAAAGEPAAAAAHCQAWLERASPEGRLALARTGRRLARAAGQGWAPLPPLARPRDRQLGLRPAGRAASRPLWESPDGPLPLEAALVASLRRLGRTALHAENSLWTTLFGLLHAEALLAPVPGMLPSPFRSAPLDLGTPDFVAARSEVVTAVQAAIEAGDAPRLLAEAWQRREREALIGVDWARYPLALLQRVAAELGGRPLAAILARLAAAWGEASRGLPDLLVLSGPVLRLPGALPARLPAEPLLAEVKGPGDQLRDAQEVWLDRLQGAGLRVELWRVEARSSGEVLGAPGEG